MPDYSRAVRIPPGLVFLAAGLLIWCIARFAPAARIVMPGSRAVAIVLGGIGIALVLLGIAAFVRARTTADPLHPEKASTLVMTGIYRYTRNPMYLGFALLLLAFVVRLSAWPGVIVVFLFVAYMNRFQIRPEEQALEARFGDAARDYLRRVRRWV